MTQGSPSQGVHQGEAGRVVGGGDKAGLGLQGVKVCAACEWKRNVNSADYRDEKA